ncbi:hypothetical protein L484_011832 [Morus notabilis]|uniref:At2g35280-like TPR domain-containing protein n=1 Tax=Morus notabilis TaxID=981085 RepID=W9S1T8_9ROSA|nr:hypothetical protein L484_011832 [Morus notabilis]
MIEEILARVATSSMRALFNTKRSCTLFNEVGNSNYVYRYVSLDRLTLNFSYMRPEECSFYQKCIESENPEAMYREGLWEALKKILMEI